MARLTPEANRYCCLIEQKHSLLHAIVEDVINSRVDVPQAQEYLKSLFPEYNRIIHPRLLRPLNSSRPHSEVKKQN